MAAAGEMFKLDRPGKDGVSMRAHLQQLEKSTGVRPAGLDAAEIPYQGVMLMRWFYEMSSGRSTNGFGYMPLAFSEMEAWSRLRGVTLTPWEVQTIKSLDREYLNVMNTRES